ncbi:Hypothetical Protein RradSPS_1025 [Rubrobacter radiotolerans]|uniref:DUF7973 domain-containing protein n=1 Tax=Rubrobacter radiotolerans TaxID=42256 RepID=A0A023X1T9_RUBRA|nr:hypothetical protein [Rubrobacter radiotolerans]AHY46308.1 Hypothetical Protein RradSPS_1025 [Rubrobacter radiotolerans]MDX5893715.1 hypothetical protein [Rubrobacter radiotolerans]SMC04341.1 conserved hypothetical protein [Rubrobacter radiotolerans DSM 5868]
MDFSLLLLIAAFGGGLFGAAIGGLPAFIFTGFLVIAGVATAIAGGEYDIIGNVAFGPVFGPHISFAGGVAAAAFAKRRGLLENGKDITAGLAGVNSPAVLLVGGAFGALGYLIASFLNIFLTGYTDTIALTVFISAVIVRLVFGNSGLFGSLEPAARQRGRFNPGEEQVWVPQQEAWGQAAVIGAGVGAISGFMYITVAAVGADVAPAGQVLGFGIAAASLIFLQFGATIPVTHHMALPAAVAAANLGAGASDALAIVIAVIGGVAGAIVGEFASRLFLIHGDTHIDPPAIAIFVMTTVFILLGLAVP